MSKDYNNDNDIEELDTKGMLEDGFFKEYAKTSKASKAKPSERATQGLVPHSSSPVNTNTEKLLLKAYDVRDNLISSFSDIKLGSSLATNVKNAINQVGSMILELGGEAENFDPLAHVSGLGAPSLDKYASRVIENTRDSYTFGKIDDAKIDGQSIIITFTGQSSLDNTDYKAIGTITTKGTWMGNEAIDYVYTPGEGKMSVKVANQQGEWIDKSDDYVVSWELFEGSPEEEEKNIEKKAETKEEETDLIQNNVDDDININFPIEEKENC